MWTRSYIISAVDDLGDLEYVTERLLRNPGDFAMVLQKFYGPNEARKFKQLLTEHLTIAAKLVTDAKAGNTNAVAEDQKKWYQNADEIAAFLSSINPYWSKRMWQSMLYEHLKITEEEATLRINKKYAENVAIYDEIESQALEMADIMTEGIIKQFGY